MLSSFNKQTKIHLDVFSKDTFLVLCDIYLVLNIVNFNTAREKKKRSF